MSRRYRPTPDRPNLVTVEVRCNLTRCARSIVVPVPISAVLLDAQLPAGWLHMSVPHDGRHGTELDFCSWHCARCFSTNAERRAAWEVPHQ
jgi:hypothetical protein